MIIIFTRHGQRIEVAHAAAVVLSTLPAEPGNTAAKSVELIATTGKILAVFRLVETSGWDLSTAGADA